MSVPPPGERGRDIGRLVKKGARTALLVGMAVKASAGLVEAIPQPANPNVGSDRGGYSQNDSGQVQNALGRPDDSGKNSSIAKGKGKTSNVSVAGTSSIPSPTIEGKYTGDTSQRDHGATQVVFRTTRGGQDIGPDSAKIAAYNATAGPDWSASSSGKTLAKPKAPTKVETAPSNDGPPDLLKGLGDAGIQVLSAFLDGGPILAACNPIPTLARETRTSTSIPTLTPAPGISEQPLATELVAKLTHQVTDTNFSSETDLDFINRFMLQKGNILSSIVGNRGVQDYTVVMPVSRDLLDTWKRGNTEPLTYIQKIKTGDKYDLIPAGKIGANIVVYRLVKIDPESTIVRFQNPDGTLSLPARILKGNDSIDAVLGSQQGDRIWFGGLGVYYDGSLLPANAPDTSNYLKQHASAIADFALHKYEEVSGGKTVWDNKINLSILPYQAPDGTIQSLIKEETEAGTEYHVPNSSGGFSRLQPSPSGMRRQFDHESGKFVYERQGPNADDPWYVIAEFNPDANNGSGAIVNIPATPTPSPTATVEATRTPTAIPRPDIQPHQFASTEPRGINIIPAGLFGRTAKVERIGDYYYSNSGETGEKTTLERLPGYDEFSGPVVHVVVNGPPPKHGNQRAYITTERAMPQPEGSWAYQVSVNVIKAPTNLGTFLNTDYPWAVLASIGMHVDENNMFRTAAGVRLSYNKSDGKYYVSLYSVDNTGRERPPRDALKSYPAPFEIGVKQAVRIELFYDPNNDNKPTADAYLVKYINGQENFIYLGMTPLAWDLNPIRQDITFLGAYTGYPTIGYEVIEGEPIIFR